jgi:hypothetical protein
MPVEPPRGPLRWPLNHEVLAGSNDHPIVRGDMVRMIRWILVLAALAAIAFFFAHRQKAQEAEPVAASPGSSISPEEAQRLIQQALAQPRETVRLRLEPSAAEPSAAPLPPPKIVAAEPTPPPPPPPPLPAPAAAPPPGPTTTAQAAIEGQQNVFRQVNSALERLRRTARAAAQTQGQPGAPVAPATPATAAPAVPAPTPTPTTP